MPLLLGTKGKDVLEWRATAELVEGLEERLGRKWARSSARDAERFLKELIEALGAELDYEKQFERESSILEQAIEEAPGIEELKPMQARYRELICAHFRRRQSVLALCDACNRLHDRILERAVYQARERMQELGQGKAPPHALLVSGDRGRGEQTLYGENRYFLCYESEQNGFLFSRQLGQTLAETGLLTGDQMFWHGTVEKWRALLGEGFPLRDPVDARNLLAALPPFAAPLKQGPQQMPEWAWRLESLTDLHPVAGGGRLAEAALAAAAESVARESRRGPFLQLARRVIGLPLAVGRFGGWRVERGGERRGELNLDELALGPLVMTVRVLAVDAGVTARGTVERIKGLLERGALDVELSGRLLKAFQVIMQFKVLSEIRSEETGSYLNPEELDEEEGVRLKGALESVLNLQKIAYQRMVGQV